MTSLGVVTSCRGKFTVALNAVNHFVFIIVRLKNPEGESYKSLGQYNKKEINIADWLFTAQFKLDKLFVLGSRRFKLFDIYTGCIVKFYAVSINYIIKSTNCQVKSLFAIELLGSYQIPSGICV